MSFALGLTTDPPLLLHSGRSSAHPSDAFVEVSLSSFFISFPVGLSTGLCPLAQSGRASFQTSSFAAIDFSIFFKSLPLALETGLLPFAQSGRASFKYFDCFVAGLFASFLCADAVVHSGFGFVFGFASGFSFGLPMIDAIGFASRCLAVRAHSGSYNIKQTMTLSFPWQKKQKKEWRKDWIYLMAKWESRHFILIKFLIKSQDRSSFRLAFVFPKDTGNEYICLLLSELFALSLLN